jgi:hypothetical protein
MAQEDAHSHSLRNHSHPLLDIRIHFYNSPFFSHVSRALAASRDTVFARALMPIYGWDKRMSEAGSEA